MQESIHRENCMNGDALEKVRRWGSGKNGSENTFYQLNYSLRVSV